MPRIGIVVVCTNAYFVLGLRFIKKFVYHYKGSSTVTFFLFTDTDPIPYAPNLDIRYIHTTHKDWRDGTNSKFSNILKLESEDYDYFFYFDADTNVSKPFTEDWFLGDLVGGEHFNNRWMTNGVPNQKPYDRNPLSKSYIPLDTALPQMYYYGAFFGGKKDRIMEFCRANYESQKADQLIPYEPGCNDESYINNYFHYNPPTFVVLSDKFMFDVSDKGELGNTRDVKLDVEIYKAKILERPNNAFNITRRGIVFY